MKNTNVASVENGKRKRRHGNFERYWLPLLGLVGSAAGHICNFGFKNAEER